MKGNMKKTVTVIVSLVMAMLMCTSSFMLAFAADTPTTEKVKYSVQYRQAMARSMLSKINELRGNEKTTIKNASNVNTSIGKVNPLEYDYDLEKAAMQRAAEIAIHFAHERPDGTNGLTAFTGSNKAENILCGSTTMAEAFETWCETNEDYEGQGHRRNMLSKNCGAIGIGCAIYDGKYYWVQEFREVVVSNTETDISNDAKDITVNLKSDYALESKINPSQSSITMTFGDEVALPTYTLSFKDPAFKDKTSSPFLNKTVKLDKEWSLSKEGIVTVSNGKMKAVKAGSVNLTVSAFSITGTVAVTVKGISLAKASVTLSQSKVQFTGSEIKPDVTVVLNGIELTKNDYTVKYEDNVKVGTATVTITGKNGYTGSTSVNFEIFCEHKNITKTEAKAATCTEKGNSEGQVCNLCGTVIKEGKEIPALGHDYGYVDEEVSVKATCTTSGYKKGYCKRCKKTVEETVPALGHDFDSGKITKQSTCTQEGEKTFECTRCHKKTTEPIEMKPHDWKVTYSKDLKKDAKTGNCIGCTYTKECNVCHTKTDPVTIKDHTWETVKGTAATCTDAGVTDKISCSVCLLVKQEAKTIKALGHVKPDDQTQIKTTKPTCSAEGKEEFFCSRCKKDVSVPLPKLEHKAGKPIVVNPTATADGSVTTKCEVCGAVISKVILPAGSGPYKPDTPTPGPSDGITIRNYTATKTVPYKASLTLTADYGTLPSTAMVRWYKNGTAIDKGQQITINNISSEFSIEAKIVSSDGSVISASQKETVKPQSGIIARVVGFFRYLLGMAPTVVQ